jgi:hypothetical protein
MRNAHLPANLVHRLLAAFLNADRGNNLLFRESAGLHFKDSFQKHEIQFPLLLNGPRFWAQVTPILHLIQSGSDFILFDTRPCGLEHPLNLLTEEQARACLLEHSFENSESQWALSHNFAVEIDGRCIPLATASPNLLQCFEGSIVNKV